MFEFTLSKINMLIFVTAIAVVVIFFMNTLNDNLKTRQSYETAFKIGKEIKSLIDSDSYCSVKFIDIPKTIKINEGSSLSGTPYKLGLQSYQQLNNQSLIIYLTDYRERNILGAYNLDYNGTIAFYSSTYANGNYSFSQENNQQIIYDPRKANSNETKFMFIKNVKDSQSYYYVLPCGRKNNLYTCREYVCNLDNFNREEIKCLGENITGSFCATQVSE